MTELAIQKSNRQIALVCVTLVGVMVGAAYAAVPLYDLFCRVTGYGGTTQRAETGADRVIDREITVQFDANTAASLGWDFKSETRSVTLKLGETTLINYRARNYGRTDSVGTSTFNVTPAQAGAYFNKLECFCFTEQALASGETVQMPVQFFVSPDAVDDPLMDAVTTITLSYTFFPVDDVETVARASSAGIQTITKDAEISVTPAAADKAATRDLTTSGVDNG